MNTKKENYYVIKRGGWFNGAYDYVVMSRDLDKIICAGPSYSCDLIAKALNLLHNLQEK